MLNSPWHWWSRLPRETRDVLFVLGVIVLTTAPLLLQVPLWCALMLVGVVIWRGALAVQRRRLPSRWVLLACLIIAVGSTWLSYRTIIGRDPGVTLLVVLLALKTLEWHSRRDAFVVFFLAFFVLLTNFFHSQSLLTALYMLGTIWGWMTVLILAHRPVGTPRIRDAGRTALGMSLLGSPLVALLFVLFPRFAPLWGMPTDAMQGRTGLSSTLQIGQIAKLTQDESVAMRIQWLDPQTRQPLIGNPVQAELYFRGPVLTDFDGQVWRSAAPAPTDPESVVPQGAALLYQTTLEPNALRALLTLDATARVELSTGRSVSLREDMQWLTSQSIDQPIRYTATAYTRYRFDTESTPGQLRRYTRYPSNLNPRTQAWGRQLRSEHPQASPEELAGLVMTTLRQGGYSYTLEPGAYGEHASDEFWFDRKVGFCEHMAVGFVIVMRSMGVPARIVTGYQGGERNGVDGYWTIRQSDAHAWAEIWQEGLGWIRMDPTSVVAPGRIGQVNRPAPVPGAVGQAVQAILGSEAPSMLRRAREFWEAANNYWNQKIIQYTQQQQLGFLNWLGFSTPTWQDALRLLGLGLGLPVLVAAIWMQFLRKRVDPWQQLLREARQRIGTPEQPLPEHITPRELSAVAARRWGAQADPLRIWLSAMEQHRYAARPKITLPQLQQAWRQLRRLPPSGHA